MASSLGTVTPEIVLCLIPFLDRPDLSRVTRTCRALRELALKGLFETVGWEYNVQQQTSPVHLLLRTLAHRPTYGSLIKHISFSYRKAAPRFQAVLGSPLTLPDSIITTIEYHVGQPHKHLPKLWKHQITNGESGACAAMVLAFLPNLETLFLDSSFVDFRCLGALLATPDCFSKLHNLHLDGQSSRQPSHRNDTRASRQEDFLPVFDLPRLTSGTIELPSHPGGQPFPAEKPRLTFLTKLHLPWSFSPPSILLHLLESSPPLKNLIYSYIAPDQYRSPARSQLVDMPSLSHAIKRISKTIEKITLGVNFDPNVSQRALTEYFNGPFEGTLTNLDQCERLTDLDIPLMMLADWHGVLDLPLRSELPGNLRRLVLQDKEMSWQGCQMTRTNVIQSIELLKEEKIGGTREALEIVAIATWHGGVGWRMQEGNKLKIMCEDTGISMLWRRHAENGDIMDGTWETPWTPW